MDSLQNLDINTLTSDERSTLMNKLIIEDIKELKSKQNLMTTKFSELQQDVQHINERLSSQDERLQQQEKITNVVGFSYNSVNLSKIRNLCRARVHQLLGKKGDPSYDLLSRCYFAKIYRDLASYCAVDKIANVHMNDYEIAIEFARRWEPDEDYITDKIEEFRHQYNNCSESMANSGKRRTLELFCQQANIELSKE